MVNHQNLELKPSVYAAICPSREVLALIGEKWVALVIGAMEGKVMRL
jgi:DNA-binding HxlR family transcriptional regulator